MNIEIWQLQNAYAIPLFKKNRQISKKFFLNSYLFGKTIKIVYKKSILKESIQSYILHGSIFCHGIYIYIFENGLFKSLIHNINLTGQRKSACCLWSLVNLEVCVFSPFYHCRSQVFSKGCCHHALKAFWENGYNSVLLNIIENIK